MDVLLQVAVFICGGLALALTVIVLFLSTLQTALNRCDPKNRSIEPSSVWLCLIPVFNFAWAVYMVLQVGKTLRREYVARGEHDNSSYGTAVGLYGVGLNYFGSALLMAASKGHIPLFKQLAMFVYAASYLVIIVYWIKIAAYSRRLGEGADRHTELPGETKATFTCRRCESSRFMRIQGVHESWKRWALSLLLAWPIPLLSFFAVTDRSSPAPAAYFCLAPILMIPGFIYWWLVRRPLLRCEDCGAQQLADRAEQVAAADRGRI